MVKIFFTRHGQTLENIKGVLMDIESSNFSKKGKEQIKKLAKRLKKESLDFIISSDSPRCKMTAKKIAQKNKIPIYYTKLLREKDNGEWAGRKINEIDWSSLKGNFETTVFPGGENLLQVRERAKKFMKYLLKKYGKTNKNILVVSHGAFLKVLIGTLIGTTLKDSILKLFIDHCSLTMVDFKDTYKEGYIISYINETELLGNSRNWVIHE